MAKTYYIVESPIDDISGLERKEWRAYKRGFWSTFNEFNTWNLVLGSYSLTSPDECERKLRDILLKAKIKPKIVRVLKI